MNATAPLPVRRKLLFSTGDLSTSLPLAILMFFQLYFLTDVAGLRPDMAIWAMGQLLALTGYVTPTAGNPLPSQPAAAVMAIRWFIGPIPIVLLLLGMACAWPYPITRERHRAMREEIAQAGLDVE